jgi:acetylornithine deacetylase/succinyl-diaminopimelate desuccinylase-like protein
MNPDDARSKVAAMMPELLAELEGFTKLASVAFPGYPEEPVRQMASKTVEVMRAAGFRDAALQPVPDGYPPIYASVEGPEGSPTVMLYAHYDVQPAPPEQNWSSDPWTSTRKDDGRLYGRGIADDKSGLVIHAGTLKAFDGTPPCHVKLIVEGMEETNSNLEAFVEAHPDLFRCDVFVVADMGNLKAGEPTLTTTLRGDVACVVTVRTLEHSLHSGVFGGPVPDAMMALARLLATLHDADGNVAVEGVSQFDWEGLDFSEADLRAGADLADGVGVIGTGTIGSRLWSKPSINAIGLDMTSIDGSSNVLIPEVRAKLSMRIVPGTDPNRELDALVRHLESHTPWGAKVTVQRTKAAAPFRAATDGPGYIAARQALADAYGSPAGEAGSGGSIPLLSTLQRAAPNAEFILWGAEDTAKARIHASDESVDPTEIEAMTLAQVFLLQDLARAGVHQG